MPRSGLILRGFILLSIIGVFGVGVASGFDTSGALDVNGTKFYIAGHPDNATAGNWVNLSGGFPITLPNLTITYNLVNATNPNNVSLTSSPGNVTSNYPYKTHAFYTNGSDVTATFYGIPAYNGSNLTFYLVNKSLTEFKNISSDLLDANVTPFQDMLNSAYNETDVATGASNGTAEITYKSVPAGDYVLLVLLNKTKANPSLDIPADANYTILSTTFITVL